MNGEIITNNQIGKSQVILRELKANVSREDKRAAKDKLGVVDSTISNYLNGKGANINTAILLMTFFQKRIAQREKAISKMAS